MQTNGRISGRRSSSMKRAAARIHAAIERVEPRVLFAAFQPGDLVVYRVGAGSAALNSASTAAFLDEYTPSGTLVQSIPLPTAAAGANNPLTASGTGSNEGLLTLSQNGQNLLLTGYDAAPGVAGIASTQTTNGGFITKATAATPIVITTGSTTGMTSGDPVTVSGVGGISGANGTYFAKVLGSTTFSLYSDAGLTTGVAGTGTYTANTGTWTDANITTGFVQREIGVVSSSGAINTSTTLGAAFPGTSIYSAASADGTSGLYAAGGNDAVYTTLGSTSTPVSLLSQGGTSGSTYGVEVVNGQLYISANAQPTVLSTLGTGLPTTAGQAATVLPGVAFSNTSGAGVGFSREFAFATLNGGSAPDTLYVADNWNDGVDKLSLVNGNWVINGEIGAFGSGGNVLSGVTGVVAQPVPGGEQLFISTAHNLYTIVDPYGYNSVGGTAGTQGGGVFSGTPPLTVLAPAATNEAFRGVEFVPQPGGAPTMATQATDQTAVVGTNATFSATAYGTNVAVQWQVSTDGGNTYSPISGATFTTLTVPATAAENGYKYEAVFTNGSGSVTSNPATLTVIPGPAFQFSASTFPTPNTVGQVTITVNRFGDSSVQDTIQYATSDGTAKAGTNYAATNGTLTFPAGATSETFTVPVTYVSSQNGALSFNIALSNVQGSNSGNAVIGSPASVTINPPFETLNLSSATYTVDDTDGTGIFTVVRSGSFSSDAGSVPYTVTGAVSASGTVSFIAGQQVSTLSVPLPAANGANQAFTVTLGSGITGFTSGGAILGSLKSATVTDVHAASTNLSGTAGSVTDIETSGPYAQSYAPVVGDVNAGTGSFGYLAYEVLEFSPATAPGLYPTLGTTVNANGISALSVQMFNADASGTDNYSGHVGNFNVYFLPDSDTTTPTSKLSFSTSATPTGLANSQFQSAPVLLGTFSFNNTAGYDAYTPAAVPASVVTALVNDLNSGASFRLAVTPQSNGKGAIATDWRGYFSGQTPILSLAAAQTVNQTPEYFAFQTSSYSVSETAGTATITLTRTGSNISDTATVNYATSDSTAKAGTNYTASSGTATFAAGSATATFTIPITDVPYQGGDKILNLSISNPATGNPSATIAGLGSPTTATLTIQDASAAPTETLTSSIMGEGDIEVNGPYDDTEIKATAVSGDFPSYGAVDFTESTPANPVTAIDGITMSLTNEPTVAAGPVDFYLVSDNTSNILPGSPQSPNPHFYDSTQGIEGFGTQFGTAMLLGKYNLTDTNGGDTLTVPLNNYSPATQAALINYLNSGSVFRILVTPENNTVDADWVSTSAAISIKVQEGGPAPAVTGLSPATGPAAGGTSVTITGSHFTGATGVEFGTTPATHFTINNDGSITAVAPAGSGMVDVTVVNAGGVSNTSSVDQFNYILTTVNVTGVAVNGNNPALAGVQRSMVDSIVYTFSAPVTLNTGAFTFAVHSGQTGTVPSLAWAAINPDGSGASTQWVVTFSGAGVTGGSIADGVYDITLNASAATVEGSPTATVAARPTDTFYRLYGDITGDGRVNNADYNQFLNAFNTKSGQTGFIAGFDASGTGSRIGNADYNLFLNNFNVRYTGFTATI